MRETLQDKIVSYMSTREWVSNVELCNVAWWRFWSSLFQLRKKGYRFEKKSKNPWDKRYVEYFRLIAKPLVVTEVQGGKIEEKELKTGFIWFISKLWK